MTRYRISVPGDDELYHSRGPWKKHKYLQKIGNKYIYGKQGTQTGGGGDDGTDYYTEGKKVMKNVNKFFSNAGRYVDRTTRGIGRSAMKTVDDAAKKVQGSHAYKSAKKTTGSMVRDAKKAYSKSLPGQLSKANKQRKAAEARAAAAEKRLEQKRKIKANLDARKREEERKRRERAARINEQHRKRELERREREANREKQRARTEEMRGKGGNLSTSTRANSLNNQLARDDMRKKLPDGWRMTDEYVRNGRPASSSKKKTGGGGIMSGPRFSAKVAPVVGAKPYSSGGGTSSSGGQKWNKTLANHKKRSKTVRARKKPGNSKSKRGPWKKHSLNDKFR